MNDLTHPTTGTTDERVDIRHRKLEDLKAHFNFALSGTPNAQLSAATRCAQASPALRSLFAPTASVRTLETWTSTRALVRTSHDGRNELLCVYNLGDQPLDFTPGRLLDLEGRSHSGLTFVSGEAWSAVNEQNMITCRLEPSSYVWLGLIDATRT